MGAGSVGAIMRRRQHQIRSEWIRSFGDIECPDHHQRRTGYIRESLAKATIWCPMCRRFWRMRRTPNWRVVWWHISEVLDTPEKLAAFNAERPTKKTAN